MTNDLLISPTEPKPLRAIGVTSSVPESFGADLLWDSPLGRIGVQRKEIKDLIASVRDGRLGKEIAQLKSVDQPILIIEGDLKWHVNGSLLNSRLTWTQTQHYGLLFSINLEGCWTLSTKTLAETISCVSQLKRWSEKESHGSLTSRGKMEVAGWGVAGHRDYAIHLLSGFPGISSKLAGRIYDKFKGVPLQWTVSPMELMEVEGLGKEKVVKMFRALSND